MANYIALCDEMFLLERRAMISPSAANLLFMLRNYNALVAALTDAELHNAMLQAQIDDLRRQISGMSAMPGETVQ